MMYLSGGHTTRNAQSEGGQLVLHQRQPTSEAARSLSAIGISINNQ